jgi:hypothetical protein
MQITVPPATTPGRDQQFGGDHQTQTLTLPPFGGDHQTQTLTLAPTQSPTTQVANTPAPGGTCGDPDPAMPGTMDYACPTGYIAKSSDVTAASCTDVASCDSNCCDVQAPNHPAIGGTCGDPDPAMPPSRAYMCPAGFVSKRGNVADEMCIDLATCILNCCQEAPSTTGAPQEGSTTRKETNTVIVKVEYEDCNHTHKQVEAKVELPPFRCPGDGCDGSAAPASAISIKT